MKKKIFTILFAILLFTVLSITVFAYTNGDVDGNGKIVASDARLALRYSAQLEVLTDEQIAAADVDGSGKVTASDARKILRVAAHLDAPFEGLNIDEYLIEEGVLNVAVPIDNAPFGYMEDGVVKGFDVDAVTKLASKTRLEVKLHPMSLAECIEAVKNGTCDIATGVNEDKLPDGTAVVGKYLYCSLTCVVLKDSELKTVADIRNNKELVVGVIEDTPGAKVAETISANGADAYFDTCADAVVALENGRIDVLITDDTYAIYTGNANGSVDFIDDETFYVVDMAFVTSASSVQLAEKLKPYITAMNSGVDWDESGRSSISVSQKKVSLRPGGTACVEITAECFYTPHPSVSLSGNIYKTSVEEINGKTYVFITAPSNLIGISYVTAGMWSGPQSYEASIEVEIDVDCPNYYQYFDGVNIPDFGAYTATAPVENMIDTENNLVIHTYLASDLYYNGVTDNTKIDCYLDALEKAGYKYMGYQEIENTVSLIFMNEKTQKYVSYVEAYDEEGYLVAVGVGYPLPDSIS